MSPSPPKSPEAAAGTPTTDHATAEQATAEHAAAVRRVLHDMNNGLEIIIQATYLVGTLDIGAEGKQWVKLLEQGVEQVTALNARLRDLVIRSQQEI